jgi:hypothetical protein
LIHDDATGRRVEPAGFQYAPIDLKRGWRAEIAEGAEIEAGTRQLLFRY